MGYIYILSEKRFAGALNLPVIKINFLDTDIDLEGYEALIFTSKNGVEAIDRIDKSWKKKDIYSIGSGTTKAIKDKGAIACYTAKSSYGDDFAKEIVPLLSGKKSLFLRAKKVTSKLNKILKDNGIELYEKIVYETVCNEDIKECPNEGSVIIFSSPSTIECFFKRYSWKDSYKAVVIGTKTASYMPDGVRFDLCSIQTIPACIELAKTLL